MMSQPPYMFCHPHANCFHRHLTESDNGSSAFIGAPATVAADRAASSAAMTTKASNNHDVTRTELATSRYVSSFFIGLSFKSGLRKVDITPSIQV